MTVSSMKCISSPPRVFFVESRDVHETSRAAVADKALRRRPLFGIEQIAHPFINEIGERRVAGEIGRDRRAGIGNIAGD